ncbi:MAG: kinesin motor protein cin8 [Peltula sp. TS41687]|nr:MAG: kinesin motor protein cin8 [Peltula sp. TS41687]
MSSSKKKSSLMRPPIARPLSKGSQSNVPLGPRYGRTRSSAILPADSNSSQMTLSRSQTPTVQNTGTKRKDRDFDRDSTEETNIHVVVRCRGRSEREIRENSGVVLSTDGIKGKTVELTMGPNAMGNKTYHFDRVFSPAADQSMICDEVITPILDEMLQGYNCTIFAYGQTGTGKTYTMSGDMSDISLGLISDTAGIVPRLLHSLFTRIQEADDESAVKCSFIELYNEELRDLLSADDRTKLKIYEDSQKSLSGGTYVQGMEEMYIKDATEGIRLLRTGSHKRQVAATKCNDLSSRSHTVFTVTTYIKRTAESGEDFVCAGKLNLVDLAGSENIQRSGAEKQRAAEAGLINKSLLTLGRVINALVDRGSHIPYRESKLTRLLQDSLGGHTKTCIIATVSSAKSNLEETISTLDYAFRAKNIRNKPQVNQMVSKKTLLHDFTMEIVKLKAELVAARQKNGVYLTAESYDMIVGESESRRILSEEQKAKIEALESTLRNKVQELHSLTTNFNSLKKENDDTRLNLDQTKDLLEQTEMVLSNTRQALAEKTQLKRAYKRTEEILHEIGGRLIGTLENTVTDVNGLHSKISRTSELHMRNRNTYEKSQQQVSGFTRNVRRKLDDFETQQKEQTNMLSARMASFVREQIQSLGDAQRSLYDRKETFEQTSSRMSEESAGFVHDMDHSLEEIKLLRDNVRGGVGHALNELSDAAARISAEVVDELGKFHGQLHSSYSSLGKDFRSIFEDILDQIDSQKSEADRLQQDLLLANVRAVEAHHIASSRLERVLEEERKRAASEREQLLSQISSLVHASGKAQDERWSTKLSTLRQDIHTSRVALEGAVGSYRQGVSQWSHQGQAFKEEVSKSRESLKSRLKQGWTEATQHNTAIQASTKTIHEKTVQIVDTQMKDIHEQMQVLDEFVGKARSQTFQHHERQSLSLEALTSSAKQSYDNVNGQFQTTSDRIHVLSRDAAESTDALLATLPPLAEDVHQPLIQLDTDISNAPLEEYIPTGETPQKTQYQYPTTLPRTETHGNTITTGEQRDADENNSPLNTHSHQSSSRRTITTSNQVYTDSEDEVALLRSTADMYTERLMDSRSGSGSLQEVDVNINAGLLGSEPITSSSARASNDIVPPTLQRRSTVESKIPHGMNGKIPVVKLEGRENSLLPVFSRRS